jgi:hypothetical protein
MFRYLIAILMTTAPAMADMTTPDLDNRKDIMRDLLVLCEISKLKLTLVKSDEFKGDPIALNFRTAAMVEVALVSPQARTSWKELSQADQQSRKKAWHEFADDYKITNWKCPTVGGL